MKFKNIKEGGSVLRALGDDDAVCGSVVDTRGVKISEYIFEKSQAKLTMRAFTDPNTFETKQRLCQEYIHHRRRINNRIIGSEWNIASHYIPVDYYDPMDECSTPSDFQLVGVSLVEDDSYPITPVDETKFQGEWLSKKFILGKYLGISEEDQLNMAAYDRAMKGIG